MELTISVRGLVEFLMREGDIDNRRHVAPEDAMQAGSRIHRKLQKEAGGDYQAEVALSYAYEGDGYTLLVDGRADGIIDGLDENAPLVTIDEIKGIYKDVNKMKEPVPVHLAQAKCYAFFYATEYEKEKMGVRMTYCNLDTEEIRYFFKEYTYEELQDYYLDLMNRYAKWAKYEVEWHEKKVKSIKALSFPFAYRTGQKELVTYVYQTIYHQKKLFIEAPTGAGKTIATVFPAVKAVGEGKARRLFYLTAKTITRTVAEEAFAKLREQGLQFKTVILTAKEKICFTGECDCNPEACPYAKGHFDRVNDAIYDLLISEHGCTRGTIEAYAEKYKVCPFELCLDLSLYADGIIGDYNYAFDPHVYLRRFFAEGRRKDSIFLIDEAHNLLERGREMYSAVLIKEDFLSWKKEIIEKEPSIGKAIEKCNKELLALKKEGDVPRIVNNIDKLALALGRLSSRIEKFLEEKEDSPVKEQVLECYFVVSHFLMIYEAMDESYRMYCTLTEDDKFMFKLFCVNPASNLATCMERAVSTILFSATLLPIQYYKSLLGGEEEDYEVYAESTFDSSRRGLFIATDVSSKYTRRGDAEYNRITEYIYEIVKQKTGNYMVFFPSYKFMEEIYERYMAVYYEDGSQQILKQDTSMREEEREAFLNAFLDESENRSVIGFCVLGGIFSEGIDLKNESLIGAIIVGTGLPQVCFERELMMDFFGGKSGDGFAYAYQYPGMNKVAQAAGRVIRTAEDIGVVALLDERFLQSGYQKLFPREWSHFEKSNRNLVGKLISDFWTQF